MPEPCDCSCRLCTSTLLAVRCKQSASGHCHSCSAPSGLHQLLAETLLAVQQLHCQAHFGCDLLLNTGCRAALPHNGTEWQQLRRPLSGLARNQPQHKPLLANHHDPVTTASLPRHCCCCCCSALLLKAFQHPASSVLASVDFAWPGSPCKARQGPQWCGQQKLSPWEPKGPMLESSAYRASHAHMRCCMDVLL